MSIFLFLLYIFVVLIVVTSITKRDIKGIILWKNKESLTILSHYFCKSQRMFVQPQSKPSKILWKPFVCFRQVQITELVFPLIRITKGVSTDILFSHSIKILYFHYYNTYNLIIKCNNLRTNCLWKYVGVEIRVMSILIHCINIVYIIISD